MSQCGPGCPCEQNKRGIHPSEPPLETRKEMILRGRCGDAANFKGTIVLCDRRIGHNGKHRGRYNWVSEISSGSDKVFWK